MIRVKVDLIPFGEESLKESLDEINISNEGEVKKPLDEIDGQWREYKIDNGKRQAFIVHRREDGFEILIKKCLDKFY